jgi:hypothetical protein
MKDGERTKAGIDQVAGGRRGSSECTSAGANENLSFLLCNCQGKLERRA